MATDSKKTKKAPSKRKPKAVVLGSMEAEVFDFNNKAVGKIELPKSVFGAAWNPSLIKQIVLAQMANLRRPWAHAKGRGEVRGGGKKPWKQKGTGRSRHGSIRSPIWKGGGQSPGPTN